MNNYKIFFEIKAYLDYLGAEYKNKIPDSLYETIERNANQYILMNSENVLEPINFTKGKESLSKAARAILFKMDYDYFAQSEKERAILLNLLKTNENKDMSYKFNKSIKEIQDDETLDQMYKRTQLLNALFD